MATAPNLDDIRVYLGNIPDDEYAARAKLRVARNASSFRVNSAESGDARALLWMCAERATAWVYAPADDDTLNKRAEHCRKLLLLAEEAENLDLG